MMFKKWASIENHYRDKFIDEFFLYNADLPEQTFLVTEKLDGANFSIIVNSKGEVSYARRKAELGDGSFFNYQEILADTKLADLILKIKTFCIYHDTTLQYVGELYGPGINGRINYGPQKAWRWFAIYEHFEDGGAKLLPLSDSLDHHGGAFISEAIPYFAPVITSFKLYGRKFQERVAEIDIDRDAEFTPEDYGKPNLMEGVVIRPLGKDFYTPLGAPFLIKYKNDKYADDHGEKKPKVIVALSEDTTKIIEALTGYVNGNRSIDLFSKHGEFEDPKQIGKYIKLYYDDVMADWDKDHPDQIIKEHEDKSPINKWLNKFIVAQLQAYL